MSLCQVFLGLPLFLGTSKLLGSPSRKAGGGVNPGLASHVGGRWGGGVMLLVVSCYENQS